MWDAPGLRLRDGDAPAPLARRDDAGSPLPLVLAAAGERLGLGPAIWLPLPTALGPFAGGPPRPPSE